MPKYNLKARADFSLGIVRLGIEGGVEWGDKPSRSFTEQFVYIDEIRNLRNDVSNLHARLAIFENAIRSILTMRSLVYAEYRRLLNDAGDAIRGSGLESGVISIPRRTRSPADLTNLSVINPRRFQKVRHCEHPTCKNLALLTSDYCFMHFTLFSSQRVPSAPSMQQPRFCRKPGCTNVAVLGDIKKIGDVPRISPGLMKRAQGSQAQWSSLAITRPQKSYVARSDRPVRTTPATSSLQPVASCSAALRLSAASRG
jgi:hypothetical protein